MWKWLKRLFWQKVFCVTIEQEADFYIQDYGNVWCMNTACKFHNGDENGLKLNFHKDAYGSRFMSCDAPNKACSGRGYTVRHI